jgi:hypothetical protein
LYSLKAALAGGFFCPCRRKFFFRARLADAFWRAPGFGPGQIGMFWPCLSKKSLLKYANEPYSLEGRKAISFCSMPEIGFMPDVGSDPLTSAG